MVTAEWIRFFQENGYLIHRRAISAEQCDKMAAAIDYLHDNFATLKETHSELHKLGEWSIRGPHVVSPEVASFIKSTPVQKLCEAFLGPDVDLYYATTAAKPPERGKSFPWHQDAGYGKGPVDYITLWTALDFADETNGGLMIVPKSHLQGVLPHEFRKSTDEAYGGPFLKDESPEILAEAIQIRLEPGDILCMHSALIHASTPNLSNKKRRGLIAAFASKQEIETYRDQIEEIPVPILRNGSLYSESIPL